MRRRLECLRIAVCVQIGADWYTRERTGRPKRTGAGATVGNFQLVAYTVYVYSIG